MEKLCKKLKEAIADERKGVEEYGKLLEEIKRVPSSKKILATFGIVEGIKADEERHGARLEHIKDWLCKRL